MREMDSTPPRILSKIDVEPQFYYGWPSSIKAVPFTAISSGCGGGGGNSMGIANTTTTTVNTLTRPSADLSNQNYIRENDTNNGIGGGGPTSSRTYCF